jgi:hypothetical protein
MFPPKIGVHRPLTIQIEQRVAEAACQFRGQVPGQRPDIVMDAIVALEAVNRKIPPQEFRNEIRPGIPFAVDLRVHAKPFEHCRQIGPPQGMLHRWRDGSGIRPERLPCAP